MAGGRVREDGILRGEGDTATDADALRWPPLHVKGDARASVLKFECDGPPVPI